MHVNEIGKKVPPPRKENDYMYNIPTEEDMGYERSLTSMCLHHWLFGFICGLAVGSLIPYAIVFYNFIKRL